MSRLTFKEPNGTWGVVGMNAENEKEKIYGCLRKLLDYENTGFAPDEIEGFAYRIDSLTERCNSLEQQVKQMQAESEISETEFTRIIDGIYNYIHHKTLKNGPIKMYPDLKISEYKKMLNL